VTISPRLASLLLPIKVARSSANETSPETLFSNATISPFILTLSLRSVRCALAAYAKAEQTIATQTKALTHVSRFIKLIFPSRKLKDTTSV